MAATKRAAQRDTVVHAVESIYRSALQPSEWPQALDEIAKCLGDVGTVLVYQREDGSYGTIVSPRLAEAQADYERHWWREDMRMRRAIERGYFADLVTFTDRDVASPAEIRTHPFYVEFLQPHGLGWFAAACLSPQLGFLVGMSVQRSHKRQPFSDKELALITRLGRHVENALRIGMRLIDTQMSKVALSEALSKMSAAVFLLNGLGRVLFSNEMGQAVLGDALTLHSDRLVARFEPERLELATAFEAAVSGAETMVDVRPRPVIVHGTQGEQLLALYILPVALPSDHLIDRILSSVKVLVIAIPFKSTIPPDATILRELFGLTLAEARVAGAVGSGISLAQTAESLGVRIGTARSTLKQVFAKMSISRQSELSSLVARLVLKDMRPDDRSQ